MCLKSWKVIFSCPHTHMCIALFHTLRSWGVLQPHSKEKPQPLSPVSRKMSHKVPGSGAGQHSIRTWRVNALSHPFLICVSHSVQLEFSISAQPDTATPLSLCKPPSSPSFLCFCMFSVLNKMTPPHVLRKVILKAVTCLYSCLLWPWSSLSLFLPKKIFACAVICEQDPFPRCGDAEREINFSYLLPVKERELLFKSLMDSPCLVSIGCSTTGRK